MKINKHIGIVACSAEGAALCYRTICMDAAEIMGRHNHPEISMHTYPLKDYMEFIYRDDWSGVANLMLSSARKLELVGASFLICPDNTIHQAMPEVRRKSSLPWLHIAEEVARVAKEKAFRKLLILGTKYLMTGPVYPEILDRMDIEYVIPDLQEREMVDSIIFNELVYGIIKPESKDFFLHLVAAYQKSECDAVVLGCTEIPLIVLPEESPLPVLDSTRILARAALGEAVSRGSWVCTLIQLAPFF